MNTVIQKISLSVAFSASLLMLGACSGPQQKNSDEPWHGVERELRYKPDGEDFVITNGNARFTRAIYGTNTGFRFETSDFPEFGLYMPNLGGSAYLAISTPDSTFWVKDAKEIVSRYSKGIRKFTVKDPALGRGKLEITALAFSEGDGLVVKSEGENIPKSIKLVWIYGGANNKRFTREGDLGADPKDCFYIKGENALGNLFEIEGNAFTLNYGAGVKVLSEAEAYENASTKAVAKVEQSKKTVEPKQIAGVFPKGATLRTADATKVDELSALLASQGGDAPLLIAECPLQDDVEQYFTLFNPKTHSGFTYEELSGAFDKGKQYSEDIAQRVKIETPDPYITPLGAVFSMAEDAVWEDPGYLHGAIGWRMPLTGWRAAYLADVFGQSERARKHFDGYAAAQLTNVPVKYPPTQDPACNLGRSQKKWSTPMYSNGYICRYPNRTDVMHHYDMNLVYIDELLWHLNWTGDLGYAEKVFPVIGRHLAWEKQLFDPDGDGLYDAYCCIWASDDLQYNSSGVTHSSAYNYRANKLAAEIASKIGEDPAPYKQEADKILDAINEKLWVADKGHWAEYVDFMGHKSVHQSAAIWSIYHAIDSDIHDPFKAYEATRYVDTEIPHIPVRARGLKDEGNYVISTTDWQPYSWSINNVAFAEMAHMTLAYWQAGRAQEAFKLYKGAILDAMYLGSGPGNITQISFYDAARGETYRDFADPVAMASRAMIQGMYGIIPDLMNGKLLIKPGFPSSWNKAELETNYIDYSFERKGKTDKYEFEIDMAVQPALTLSVRAPYDKIESVRVNGKDTPWMLQGDAVGHPQVLIEAGKADQYDIEIRWNGSVIKDKAADVHAAQNDGISIALPVAAGEIFDPQGALSGESVQNGKITGKVAGSQGHRTLFVKVTQGEMSWWMPVNILIEPRMQLIAEQENDSLSFVLKNNTAQPLNGKLCVNGNFVADINIPANSSGQNHKLGAPVAIMGTNEVSVETPDGVQVLRTVNWNVKNPSGEKYETVDLSTVLNDRISNIYAFGKYMSPRSPYTTLQIPTQGVGFWCHPTDIYEIDDSGLSKTAGDKNLFVTPQGVPFATPGDMKAKNVAFTTLWDNYPDSLSVPLAGKASHVYLLMGGSTNHMQANFVNGVVTVRYADGTCDSLELVLPDNWVMLEQDIYTDGYAFRRKAPAPYRVHLPTGAVSRTLGEDLRKQGLKTQEPGLGNVTGRVSIYPVSTHGGAALILDIPLDKSKELTSLALETRANEVVIGLMSATLVR